MRLYYDIEQDTIITEQELMQDYLASEYSENGTFEQYLTDCLTQNNGTLEIVKGE